MASFRTPPCPASCGTSHAPRPTPWRRARFARDAYPPSNATPTAAAPPVGFHTCRLSIGRHRSLSAGLPRVHHHIEHQRTAPGAQVDLVAVVRLAPALADDVGDAARTDSPPSRWPAPFRRRTRDIGLLHHPLEQVPAGARPRYTNSRPTAQLRNTLQPLPPLRESMCAPPGSAAAGRWPPAAARRAPSGSPARRLAARQWSCTDTCGRRYARASRSSRVSTCTPSYNRRLLARLGHGAVDTHLRPDSSDRLPRVGVERQSSAHGTDRPARSAGHRYPIRLSSTAWSIRPSGV